MASLAIHVLGSFQVHLNQENVTLAFRTKKERALLAHLAVEANRPHRREALAELLWPERPEGYARTNLRQALLGLRRAIGQETLTITDEFIQFNSNPSIWLDAQAFIDLVHSTLTHPHHSLESCHHCAQKLQEAIALYRGDFLEDVMVPQGQSFQEWVVFYREQHFRQLLSCYRSLSDYYQNEGDYELAYKFAWQYVNLAPLEEAAHRQLMNLLTISGRRSAALEQYHACRLLLAKELGVEPSPETVSLYEKIKTGVLLDFDPAVLNLQLTNLPVQLTSFFGREGEIERLEQCLANPVCRLISLVGMPGVGKTCLALHVARNNLQKFSDGVWYTTLGAVNTLNALAAQVAAAIGVPFDEGKDPKAQLFRILKPLKTLLVLDQFENLLQETGLLVELLQQAPGLKLVVTSRVRLNFQAACLFDIQGLSYPAFEQFTHAVEFPAVQMFLARAQHSQTSLILNDESMANILQICQLVDGLPLAIELAAASLRGVSLEYLVQELQTGQDILTTSLRDLPEQHRSLWAAFEPLWGLLTESEKRTCEKLSIFQGGFTAEAAQALAGASLAQLSSLADKSLLSTRSPGKFSFHPLLRHYAAQKLSGSQSEKGHVQENIDRHLSQRATRDPLTNLPNQELFWDRLEHSLGRAQRKKQLLAMILVEVVFIGQEAGTVRKTQALREVALRLLECLRKVDTVTRLSDQRFAIILDELSVPEDGELVAKKILNVLKATVEVEGELFTIQANLGLSVFPKDGEDSQTLVQNAEAGLNRQAPREQAASSMPPG
jgi:diguanylate cyclase (GGDEF)-like protein